MTSPAQDQIDASVHILMGVHNGAAFLGEQLMSLSEQSHKVWHLTVSDDGSTDETPVVMADFAAQHTGAVTLKTGPKQGFSANFMQLIRDLPAQPGHVTFADQDDIWMPDKITRGMAALADSGTQPTLYCCRRWYWTPDTDQRSASPGITQPCTFRNALIENVASGNTIVLNPAAAELARVAAQRVQAVYAHDWWLYLLITGAGGRVVFDNGAPSLLYRQHDSNVIGAGQGITQQIARKVLVMKGAFSERLQSNLTALNQTRDLLTEDVRIALDQFATARSAGFLARLAGLHRVKPYRQSLMGNIGFWGAASLGRI